ncbi:hypothetical protein PQX77_002995 [Marasmius sp. AFHP31]|nr:hypothetical protein PQX77_002995 [Marasmius sp. AFHP31]
MQSDMMDGDPSFRVPPPPNTTRIKQQLCGKILYATEYPEFGVQGPISGAESEDHLKVTMYAAAGAKKGGKFPVLLYIYGGGALGDITYHPSLIFFIRLHLWQPTELAIRSLGFKAET